MESLRQNSPITPMMMMVVMMSLKKWLGSLLAKINVSKIKWQCFEILRGGVLNTKHNRNVKKKKGLKGFSGTLLERDTETESKNERD